MGKRIAYFIIGFAVWMLLVYTFHYQEVIAGAGVALLTAAFFGQHLPVKPSRLLNPVRWLAAGLHPGFCIYVPEVEH